jgi:hypothetical protein
VGAFAVGVFEGVVPGVTPWLDQRLATSDAHYSPLARDPVAQQARGWGNIVGGAFALVGGGAGTVGGVIGGGATVETGVGAVAGYEVAAASAAWAVHGFNAIQRGLVLLNAAKGGDPRPEAKYEGSGKHGVNWKEGPATSKSTGKSQGQWSQKDLEYAATKAGTLKAGEGAWFDLPEGSTSVVHRPDGTTAPATRFWVRNNGTGTFHGYPAE